MNHISEHNYEEWFFEYFEGHLSKEKKNLVLDFIEKDPAYREEFEYWERSYVREPLPEKLKIETILLKRNPLRSYYIYGGIAVLIITLVVLYSVLPLEKETKQIHIPGEEKRIIEERNIVSPVPETKNIKPLKIKNESQGNTKASQIPAFSPELNTEPLEKTEASEKSSKQPEADTVLIPATDQLVITEHTTKSQEKIVTKESRKTLSREEKRKQREIEKLKQKALEKKAAQEFLKGKVPYVVPIDPNTF